MYQILQKFDIHWHDGGPSIAMMYHLRRVSDLLCNWKSCLLCYMKDVVLHCSIFFKWNKLVRVREFEFDPWLQSPCIRGSLAPESLHYGIPGSRVLALWDPWLQSPCIMGSLAPESLHYGIPGSRVLALGGPWLQSPCTRGSWAPESLHYGIPGSRVLALGDPWLQSPCIMESLAPESLH